MSTIGIGIKPAAPDQSEKRSTNFDAASSRSWSVIDSKPVAPASLLSAVPPAVVSCAIFGSFHVTCTGPNDQVEKGSENGTGNDCRWHGRKQGCGRDRF